MPIHFYYSVLESIATCDAISTDIKYKSSFAVLESPMCPKGFRDETTRSTKKYGGKVKLLIELSLWFVSRRRMIDWSIGLFSHN